MNKFNGLGLGLSDSLVAAATKIVIEGKEYKDFFNAALKKFGVTSPAELKVTMRKNSMTTSIRTGKVKTRSQKR